MKKRIYNRNKKLGKEEKKLQIKLLKRRDNYYDVVLSRKRTKSTSRLCRFGYYEVIRNSREQHSILCLDFVRIAKYLCVSELDSSFAKILIQ